MEDQRMGLMAPKTRGGAKWLNLGGSLAGKIRVRQFAEPWRGTQQPAGRLQSSKTRI